MGEFGSKLLSGLGSSLGSGIVGMGLNFLGQGISSLFGSNSFNKQKELMDYQQQLELERMGLQADYNKQMADYNQANAKEMYDYTFDKQTEYNNPSAEKKRLIEAGLNPALMYGKGGAGGGSVSATTSGGQAGAVNALQPMALQVALQKQQIDMQKKLNDAQVAKTYAEAAKIAGADIENVKANTENLEEMKNQIKANIESLNEKTKLDKFQNLLNDIKKKTKYWGDRDFESAFTELFESEWGRDLIQFDTETQEYINRREVAERLIKDLDKIANGIVAEAEKKVNERDREDFELRQDRALEDIINSIGGDGKYGRLLSKILAFVAAKL